MDRKTITFLVVSNRKGTTRRVSISSAVFKASLVLFIVFGVITMACAVDYVGLLAQSIENRQLRAQNTQLKEQFRVVEGKLNSLENGLDRVKGFVTKLKLITSVDQEDRSLHLAIGPLPKVGSALDKAREPSSMLPVGASSGMVSADTDAHDADEVEISNLKQDGVFYQKPPADETEGELSVEGQRDYGSLAVRIDQAVRDTTLREQSVIELWESLSERQNLISATPRIKPTHGWLTSKFGYRISPFTGRPMMHAGLDIAAPAGSPITATADGIVSFAGYDAGYGKLVSIDHGYGVVTRFGHTSQIYVTVGQKVHMGDVIAAVGSTGRSTGPHVHYEVRVNNVPVDPQNYLLED